MLGLDIAFEPTGRPAIQFNHRCKFLATERHTAQDKVLEAEIPHGIKKVAQQRPGGCVFPAAFDKVEHV
ncbi:hypothetical protein [Mesorhizobium sp.]|uniref:hypothetical protein n=1 Tax=Mesorhizobium sp. TaxID=1871066 RepID=UPI0025D7816E|nr:hypothetical protein [Mesorhizobium sp.]